MALFPVSPGEPNYGIQDELTINTIKYIIQNMNPGDSQKGVEWEDQLGRRAGKRHVDLESTATFSLIGPAATPTTGQSVRLPLAVGAGITLRGLLWSVSGITEAGTHNGMTVWTVSVERSSQWPDAGATLPDAVAAPSAALPVTPAT